MEEPEHSPLRSAGEEPANIQALNNAIAPVCRRICDIAAALHWAEKEFWRVDARQQLCQPIRLDVSNSSQIAAELGVTPWPIDELRHLRNFIAHKSKRSALSVRGAGIVGTSDKIDVLNAALRYGPDGAKRYVAWTNFSKGAAARLAA